MNFIGLSMKSKLPYSLQTKMTFLRNRGIIGHDNIFHHEITKYAQKWDANDFVFDPPITPTATLNGANPPPPGGPAPGTSGSSHQASGSSQSDGNIMVRAVASTSKGHAASGASTSSGHSK